MFAGLTIAFSVLTAISLLATLLVGNNASQCNSGLGQFAQAFDQQAAGQCSVVNTAHALLIFATVVLGIVSVGFLAATIDRIRR